LFFYITHTFVILYYLFVKIIFEIYRFISFFPVYLVNV